MFETMQVGPWLIETDREATTLAYQEQPLITEQCACTYCRNYAAAYTQLPTALLQLFDQLGINPLKEAEVCDLEVDIDRASHLYTAAYHCVGRIVETLTTPKVLEIETAEILLTTNVYLVPDNFPRPVVQLELFANLPWILGERAEAR